MTEEILLIVSNAITGIAGWFVGKRKMSAETDNMVLRNLEVSIGVYQTIIQDLKKEIHDLNNKISELEGKVDMLMKENRELKSKAKTKE